MSNTTEQFDIELLKQLRELGATEIEFPGKVRVIFPSAVVKTVDVQAKVARIREKVDPDADRKKFYAQVLGAVEGQHE